MLKIDNLSYRYPSRKQFTLKNINLTLADGEMLLLAGRSGCGKSTLIKAISGLLGSEERGELQGAIYLQGEDISKWPPEKTGQLVGTVYQSPDDQLFAMTVADEVGFALENQGEEPEIIARKVSETLQLVGLGGFEDYSIHKLSGGQRQRLALASILVTRPGLLILDEPVSQMNPQGVQSFMQLLVRLNREAGIAILMIEHRVNELCKYFSRLAVMQEGRIVYDGLVKDAWQAMTGRTDLGLREPQTVKLCRALQLSELTTDQGKIVQMLRSECEPAAAAAQAQPAGQQQPLLEARDLYYTYPGSKEPTLKKLQFTLYQGQITAIMGFNGAGKSTLMNLLGGLTQTQQGSMLLAGQPVDKQLGKIGYLRQEPDLMLLADTVREELCWKNYTITQEELQQLLEHMNLEEYADDFPLALSKGQRLRVVLGAMLAKKPALLLLDEPTTGQDEQSLAEIRRLLLAYKEQGGSIFICTHDMELAAQVADRVIVLCAGQIIADGTTEEVLSNKELVEAGGLTPSALLPVCEQAGLPPCITVEGVKRYVRKTAVGRN
ncbi:energy-coupling factor transporter ATPase [Phascolarctobacterium succinatutens]|uniref:ABC transporter ATP-binding protein n=1 Tax=Phascolarctobacterium succinatutens TaxID=626940 RepID=UPI002E765032|nr:energy-coupling factor transporter ATPase [Phascolarctobacterium succinatutens]MEE0508819.1 energy-coupling factor transporter ATPase [Phascolarctobacterium succinatutens]